MEENDHSVEKREEYQRNSRGKLKFERTSYATHIRKKEKKESRASGRNMKMDFQVSHVSPFH